MNRVTRINMMAGAAITLALLLAGCSSDEADVATEEKEIIRPVKLLTIKSTDAINIRRFPAELQASEEVDLAFRVSGQIIELNATSGQRVKEGDLLATLDPTDFALQVELAEANQKLAETQFKRIQTMLEQNATTRAQYDSSKATLDQANNALQTAKNQLKYTKVYAPFDGVIASVDTENFQYVSATQKLMHIQNIDKLEVDFQVPESLVVSIRSTKSNYTPRVIVDVAPEDLLFGSYKEHKTTPDPNTKAYDVTLNLIRKDNGEHTLLPGMTANIDMDLNQLLGEVKHYTVPVEAVLRHENTTTGKSESSVWVFDEDAHKVTSRAVKLGTLHGDSIEILEGLKENDRIVTAGVHSLTESMQVRPWTRERGL